MGSGDLCGEERTGMSVDTEVLISPWIDFAAVVPSVGVPSHLIFIVCVRLLELHYMTNSEPG